MSARPSLLLVGAGDDHPTSTAAYREYTLASLAATHPVVLVDSDVPDWAHRYLAGHIEADLTDRAATAAAIDTYTTQHGAPAGAMTYMERHVVLTAHLAQQLGLPTSTPEAMTACRDKVLSRRLLAQHQVPSARSVLAADADAAVAHADLIGYPVVVKPQSLAGSAGVMWAHNRDQVRKAYEQAGRAAAAGQQQYGTPGVIVEEALIGSEISVETAVLAPGRTRILAVTRKLPAPANTTQEYGHCVDAMDPLLQDEDLHQVISAAVDALGVSTGVLCIEVMLTASGPRIVEVNGRLGGDLLQLLVKRALGIDLAQVAAALATGTPPYLTPLFKRAAAIQFAYPAQTGRLSRLSAPAGLSQQPGVERVVLLKSPGAYVAAPPAATLDDRLALWVVTGAHVGACHTRLRHVANQLDITVEAADHATACVA
ncbi:ATP-grasp domain-containing protein [Streptomyces minutiscleroticus]|uniref:ATP-grasp domain-containing protein n=1 Tax=Streptomyces minutiscleroticus TaxID=68238 RepID=UPI00167E99B3|nr:ATP-grasp domain-containing protein [Streptomyces minutiscleroticus]